MRKFALLVSLLILRNAFAQNGYWTQVGMLKFPFNPSVQTTGLGRICDVAFHPTNNQIIYAVSSSGGLFKTENEAQTWKAISDTLVALSCASVAVKPDNGNYILLGTGDANYNSTSKAKGVYKSLDGGKTWSLSNTGMANKLVTKLLFHPTQTNLVWAACSDGIYKSTDTGATWVLKTTIANSYRSLELKANVNTKTLFAATNTDFYYSTNWGETWTQLSHAGTGFDTQGSIAMSAIKIGVSVADSNTVYTVVWDNTHRFGGLFKSTNAGLNWTLQSYAPNPSTVTNPNILGYQADGSEWTLNGQGAYNLAIAVDPININTIYVGAINIWKSTDAGVSWTLKSHWGYGVHADKHYFGYSPHYTSPYKMYCGNDGGMYRTLDDWTTWSEISQGIAATEFTKLGQSPVYKEVCMSGTQDNGLNLERDLDFYTIRGGDWYGDFEFDPRNPNVAYFNGGKRRVTKSGGAETDILNPNGTNGFYICHQTDSNYLFSCDSNVYRSANIKTPTASNIVWTKITNNLFNSNTSLIRAAACSAIDPNLFVMLRSDKLFIKSNNILASTPTFTSYPTPALATPVNGSCIEINRIDPSIVYVAIGSKIYKSTNQGQTWIDFSGTLPAKTILKIIHDKYSTDESIYACNSAAVYYRNNTMSDWISYSNGLPAIADIVDMELVDDGSPNGVLRTAFYGRGIFQSALRRNLSQSPTALFNYYSIPSSCNNLYIFNDLSVGQPITSRTWTVNPSNGATFVNNSNSISQSPQLLFNAGVGTTSVTLTITNASGTSSYTKYFTFAQLAVNASCNSTYSSGTGSGDLISRVRLGTLDNSSVGAASPYFTSYSCLNSTILSKNVTYSLTVNFGSDANQYCGAWIDYNNDNIFTASEWIGGNTVNAGANGSTTITLTVPNTATIGTLRLRIRGGDDAQVTSAGFCGAGVWGETEDYPIIISGTVPSPICTNLTLPYNHQTLATTATTLTWESAAGATSYDVYLGTDANPSFVANTTSLTYAATLLSATQYYWKIVPKVGTSAAISCATWDFVSGPFTDGPSCTFLASPTNNSMVANATQLVWEGLSEATGYDVYLGTTNPPTTLLANNTTQTTYNLFGLANGTRYYWYVSPRNAAGIATGCNSLVFAFDIDTSTTTSNYCIPVYASGGNNDVITRVRVANIDNTSTGNVTPYYVYYSGVAAGNLYTSTNYNLILNFGSDANQFCAAWIDYNQDGQFNTTTEFLGNNIVDAGANGTYTINFTVPSNAIGGITRLRLRGGDDAALTSAMACGVSANAFGQTEDYNVNLHVANRVTVANNISTAQCATNNVTVNYTATGTFTGGNIFTAQLSDASGSFASPTAIGTTTATTSGTIACTLPSVNGANFRVRVVSSTPAITSVNNNGVDLNIGNSGVWLGATSDWNTASNWCGGVPTSATNIFVKQSVVNKPILSANAVCNNINLDANATISLNGNTLTINGAIQGQGNFIGSSTSSIIVNGTGNAGNLSLAQTNTTTKSLLNLTVNRNATGKLFLGRNLNLIGTLTMSAGTLYAGNKLTLKSSVTATARIAAVAAGASVNGDVIAERFIPGGATGWALLGSPVVGTQIADWQDDFPTSGFLGATGTAGGFTSIYGYAENANGATSNGYVPPTNVTNVLPVGTGYWAYIGTGQTSTSDINMEVAGPVKIGAVSLPVTYTTTTPSALPNEDGWNLVANPYCSTIDWDAGSWTKTNISNATYVYNADLGQYATYIASAGVNGGTRYIASSQAFKVKATAANPVLTIQESVKAANNVTFMRQAVDTASEQTIKLITNNGEDECLIRLLPAATNLYDVEYDAQKLIADSWHTSLVYSINDNKKMAINSLNYFAANAMIPLGIKSFTNAPILLTANIPVSLNQSIHLFDSHNISFTDLIQNPTNTVFADVNDSVRYYLALSNITNVQSVNKNYELLVYPNPAHNQLTIVCNYSDKEYDVMLIDALGRIAMQQKVSATQKLDITHLSNGVYQLKLMHNNNVLVSKFVKH